MSRIPVLSGLLNIFPIHCFGPLLHNHLLPFRINVEFYEVICKGLVVTVLEEEAVMPVGYDFGDASPGKGADRRVSRVHCFKKDE